MMTERGAARRRLSAVLAVLAVWTGLSASAAAQTLPAQAPAGASSVLERVRSGGVVRCGVDYTPGFSGVDPVSGRPSGLEVDICRAVAAATLGDAGAVEMLRINTANKFKALVAGELEVALGMATWTYGRDAGLGVEFPATIYYDGQGFMTWTDSAINSLADLRDKKICVQSGTTSQANLDDLQVREGFRLVAVPAKSSEEKFNAFSQRQCDAVTGDRSELAARRAVMSSMRDRWVILPETISREPLAPVVAEADTRWTDIVRWVVFVLITAEQKGISSANIDAFDGPNDGETLRLLGNEAGFGAKLGLDDQWARQVIRQVGNYGEIFARHLGPDTAIGLNRGLNAPWTRGGLLFAPPLR